MVTKSPDPKVIDLKHPEATRRELRAAEIEEELADFIPPPILEWWTLEHDHIPKEGRWFLYGGIAAVVLAIIGLLMQNYFFVLFVVVASLVVYLYAKRHPQEILCSISAHGVQIGRNVYDFESLHSFWIFYELDGIKHLSLESKKALLPRFSVPLGDADPVTLRRTLIKFVNEVEHEESLADIFARMAGF